MLCIPGEEYVFRIEIDFQGFVLNHGVSIIKKKDKRIRHFFLVSNTISSRSDGDSITNAFIDSLKLLYGKDINIDIREVDMSGTSGFQHNHYHYEQRMRDDFEKRRSAEWKAKWEPKYGTGNQNQSF